MKTKRQYDETFEELMTYSDFTKVEDVDVKKMLTQIKQDNPKFKISKKLVFEMFNVQQRLTGTRKAKETRPTRRQIVLESRTTFKNFKDARKKGLTAINPVGKEVFKVKVRIKNKNVFRYRDEKGRWAKKPTIPEN